jgi:hypothetical protein
MSPNSRPDPISAVRRAKARAARNRIDESDHKYRTLPAWAELVRPLKMKAVAHIDCGDMPPAVLAIRRGRVEAAVIASQVDKDLGLQAVFILRRALDPDALILATDNHEYAAASDADFEEARKTWRGGRMQNAREDLWLGDKGRIVDCLKAVRVVRGGRVAMASMGYVYHGKGGPDLRWLEGGPASGGARWTDRRDAISGYLSDALKSIMRGPGLFDEAVAESIEVAAYIREMLKRDPEHCRRIAALSAFRLLEERGYLAIDSMEEE